MTKNDLLDALKSFTKEAVGDILCPAPQSEGGEVRQISVYKMRLPESAAAHKKTPYIIHQVTTGTDTQTAGNVETSARCNIRSIFAIYHQNEEEGALLLLQVMERVRIQLLRSYSLNGQFVLDREAGIETLVYADDTAPYFIGEMSTVWKMPGIRYEVNP